MSCLVDKPEYTDFFEQFPYLLAPLQHWCGTSIGELSTAFQSPTPSPSPIILTILYDIVAPILGHDIANALIDRLQCSSRVIATHHLGIDCLPELVQSVHFLELQKLLQPNEKINTIPILACSGIPLQSFTYPRGLMPSVKNTSGKTIRYPLFPSNMQNCLVYSCPALQKKDILRIMQKWNSSLVSTSIWQTIQYIMHKIVLHDDCLNHDTFSKQIMYINSKLFKTIYPENPNTHVISLNLEEITKKLIIHDLQNKDSIINIIFFNQEVRTKIVDALINLRGCWTEKVVHGDTLHHSSSEGTLFFWGIDAMKRRVPLILRTIPKFGPCLCYQDIIIPFNPDSIIQALYEKRIYCSLFTSFITLHLEHHLQCYGGIYMAHYLPTMLETVKKILEKFLNHTPYTMTDNTMTHKIVEDKTLMMQNVPYCVSKEHASLLNKLKVYLPFTSLASGPITVQHSDLQRNEHVPAGSLELIAQGGINRAQLTAIAEYSCDDLLPLMLHEWSSAHLSSVKSVNKR